MKFLGNESGVSMIELVVSLGVTASIVVGVSTFMVNSSNQEAHVAFLAARDSIYNKAIKYVSNRDYINAKARSSDNSFFDCWGGGSGNCARASPSNKGTDLSILYGESEKATLIGRPSDPAIYNRWGSSCGTKSQPRNSKSCPSGKHIWEVSVEYWFSCQGGLSSCANPISANFKVYVRKNPALESNPSWNPFKSLKVKDRFPDYWINLLLRKQKSSGFRGVRCLSAGTYQEGLSTIGKPICKCLPTHRPTGRTVYQDQPECAPLSCVIGTTNNIGLDKNGVPICVGKRYRVQCGDSFKVASGRTCGPNGWISVFELGDCSVRSNGGGGGKKGGGSLDKEIKCNKDKITCCKWKRI